MLNYLEMKLQHISRSSFYSFNPQTPCQLSDFVFAAIAKSHGYPNCLETGCNMVPPINDPFNVDGGGHSYGSLLKQVPARCTYQGETNELDSLTVAPPVYDINDCPPGPTQMLALNLFPGVRPMASMTPIPHLTPYFDYEDALRPDTMDRTSKMNRNQAIGITSNTVRLNFGWLELRAKDGWFLQGPFGNKLFLNNLSEPKPSSTVHVAAPKSWLAREGIATDPVWLGGARIQRVAQGSRKKVKSNEARTAEGTKSRRTAGMGADSATPIANRTYSFPRQFLSGEQFTKGGIT
ncbi:hypothetical protein DFH07DRAFT_770543 [Mycena maculata]|uniref:Uncharacterized protein n=1 Tax=Mycena maculata TaxID=230809 RepID=A0AAD7NK12_9AGAR|nr:hypothetical protein DFH07DRAFT_770543 [Mycena maculata]